MPAPIALLRRAFGQRWARRWASRLLLAGVSLASMYAHAYGAVSVLAPPPEPTSTLAMSHDPPSGPAPGPSPVRADVAPEPARRPARLVFVGDVLLARGVIQERNARGVSPWREWRPFFAGADWVMGNLEGAVGPMSECSAVPGPCFAIPDSLLADARTAGFTSFSLANNHSADLGAAGYARTRSALLSQGLLPVGFGDSPVFQVVGGRVVAFLALSLVPGKDGRAQSLPGLEEGRKLRFARAFAERVVVFVHWGGELRDWAEAGQIEGARWLARRGADLILGAHPHVVQPAVCVAGVPVFYSLGNHLFDQKYPETRRGLAADCLLGDAGFACRSLPTAAAPEGFFPRPPDPDAAAGAGSVLRCADSARSRSPSLVSIVTTFRKDSMDLGWTRPGADGRPIHWSTSASGLLCAAPFRLRGDSGAYLFTLERHRSNLDGENAPRPYVYFLGPRGPVAKWRGSGLAWPLLDAAPLPSEPGVLCALHRGDSFLIPDSSASANRVAAYRWNGFGFSMAKEAGLDEACRAGLGGTPSR